MADPGSAAAAGAPPGAEENLAHVSWRDPQWLAMHGGLLDPDAALMYFATSPFYDHGATADGCLLLALEWAVDAVGIFLLICCRVGERCQVGLDGWAPGLIVLVCSLHPFATTRHDTRLQQ